MVIDFATDLKPKSVVIAGDLADMYALSDFDKRPFTETTLDREIRETRKVLQKLGEIAPVVWIGGNHEDRLRRFIWKNASKFEALGSTFRKFVEGTSIPEIFNISDFGCRYIPYGDGLYLGKLFVTHGTGRTAKAELMKSGCSVLYGHSHHFSSQGWTNRGGMHGAFENGCLCSLKPEYIHGIPDWQHCFAVVNVASNGLFHCQQIPILNRKAFFYGPSMRSL